MAKGESVMFFSIMDCDAHDFIVNTDHIARVYPFKTFIDDDIHQVEDSDAEHVLVMDDSCHIRVTVDSCKFLLKYRTRN
jgi:hypothetical protein